MRKRFNYQSLNFIKNKSIFLFIFGIFFIFGLFVFSTQPTLAADVYWTNGNGTGIWSDSLNWSTGSVPGTSDTVYFNGDHVDDAVIDVDTAFLNYYDIQAGYTGTITQAQGVDFSAYYFRQYDGNYIVGDNATILVNRNFELHGGSFTAGGSIITINRYIQIDTGVVFDAGTSTVIWHNDDNFNKDLTIANNTEFYNLTINGTSGKIYRIVSGYDIIVLNDLALYNGVFNEWSGSQIYLYGDLVVGASWDGGNEPLIFSGTSTQYIDLTGATDKFNGDVTINKTSGEVIMQSDFILDYGNQDLTITSGTLNLNGNNLTVNGSGGIFNNEDTLKLIESEVLTLTMDTDSGTVEYVGNGDGNPDSLLLDKDYFYNLSINLTDSNDVLSVSGLLTDLTVSNTLSISANSTFDLNGVTSYITTLDNNNLLKIQGDELNLAFSDSDSGTIEFVGNGDGLANNYYLPTTNFYNLKVNFIDANDTLNVSTVARVDSTNLVARWDFEDTAEDRADNVWIARDRTGHGYDTGYYNSNPFWDSGILPYSTENNTYSMFLDSNDAMKLGTAAPPALAEIDGFPAGYEPRALCLWARKQTVDTNNHFAFGYGDNVSDAAMDIGSNGTSLVAGGYSAGNFSIASFWEINVWHHLCLNYDGTTSTLYADGKLIDTRTADWNLVPNDAWIGAAPWEYPGDYWTGWVDDIRIYSTVLNSTEVNSLANGTSLTDITSVNINNDLIIESGSFEASTADVYIAGDILNSDTYLQTAGTTYLDGGDQTITGTNTFYNLSKIVSSTYTLTLPASTTTTISGTTTLQGIDGATLNIRSSSDGVQALMDPQGDRDVRYLDAKDNNNTNAEVFSCTIGCVNSGNLTNWTFVDPSIQVTIADVTVDESAGTVTFTTTLSGTPGGDATVDYYTSNNTAESGADYTSATGTLTWSSGTNGDKTTTITILDDALDESDETFFVYLNNPINTNITDDQAIITITDNDASPIFSVADNTVEEVTGSVDVSVSMTNKSGTSCSVDYTTSNSTALSGADYTATSGTLTWTSGEDGAKTFSVTILDDSISEIDETFTVTLSGNTCGTISDDTASITILANDSPPNVIVSDGSRSESFASIPVSVTITGADTVESSIDYATSDGTALAGVDYTATSGTLTWSAGETGTKLFYIPILGDTWDEVDENLTVTLSNAVNLDVLDSTATLTIVDNDPTPTLAVANATVAENGGTATITTTLTNSSAYVVSVNYTTVADTATATDDYTTTSGVLTWAAGETGNKTFTVNIENDGVSEDDETFNILLSSPNNATISDGTGVVTILDDDSTPNITMSGVSVSESTNATVTVSMSGISSKTITVDYATADVTTTVGSDYYSQSGTLTWTPGETGAKTFVISIIDDNLDESNETLTVNLSNAVNCNLSNASAIVTIQDNDPYPYFTAEDVNVIESVASVTAGVYMHYASALTASVDYTIVDDTAVAGQDYTATSGTLSWSPGETGYKYFDIGIIDDLIEEGTEQANIVLSNPVHATIADSMALLILDDDGTPQITIADKTVSESDGTISVILSMAGTSASTITVDYATADNTTTADSDYNATSGTVTWTPGQTGNKTISIVITNDVTIEGTESFYVNLSNVTGGAVISDSQAEIVINDNEGLPTLIVNNVSAGEGDSTLTFNVSKTGIIDQIVSVDYTTSDGTADSSDYTTASGTVTWAAGESDNKQITVNITDDSDIEDSEYFYVNLSNAQNSIISDGTGVGTIEDNDTPPVISIADVTVNEATSAVTVTATLTGYYHTTVTADYTTANDTAILAKDYTLTSGTLTWVAGETGDKTILIPILNDPLDEPSEDFYVLLSNLVNCTSSDTTAIVTITDNDATPTLEISDAIINEGSGTLSLYVTMTGQSQSTVSVSYATADNTALAGTDYTSKSGNISYLPGQTDIKPIIISILDDSEEEGPESFYVNLTSPTNATISDSQGGITLIDSDGSPTVYFLEATKTVNEIFGSIILTVDISHAPTSDATIQYSSSDSTALAGTDYTTVNGYLTWLAGDDSSKTITIPIINDAIVESTKTFAVSLSSPTNVQTGPNDESTITIEDDDGVLLLSVADLTVNEGTGIALMTITASGTNESGATVNYTTSNYNATAGDDYQTVTGVITWGSGDTSNQTAAINIVDDVILESTETLYFTLSNPLNAVLLDGSATITILDDDTLSTISIDDVSVNEGAGTATMTVTMDGYYNSSVSVDYSTSNGTATTADYTAVSDTLTWVAGETGSQTFTIDIVDDDIAEEDEVFTVNLSNVNNATISDSSASVTILDNDTPGISIIELSNSTVVEEGGLTDSYIIVLNTEPTDSVVVSIVATDQISLNALTVTFTTSNWNVPQTITVTAVDDTEVELTQSATIEQTTASTDPNYNDLDIATINVAITDNDTTLSGGILPLPPALPTNLLTNIKSMVVGNILYLKFTEVLDEVAQVALSNDLSFKYISWQAYKSNINYTLNFANQIYVKFLSNKGAESKIFDLAFDIPEKPEKAIEPIVDIPVEIIKPELPVNTITIDYNFVSFLNVGSVGEEVRNLQTLLEELGYYNYPSITGYFGNVTRQAVIDFQKANGVEPLGWVGPATRSALNNVKTNSIVNNSTTDKPITIDYNFVSFLNVGSVGEEVRNLQTLLEELGYYNYPSITGYFGNVTRQAVIDFQKANGVEPLGWVGPATRSALNNF